MGSFYWAARARLEGLAKFLLTHLSAGVRVINAIARVYIFFPRNPSKELDYDP